MVGGWGTADNHGGGLHENTAPTAPPSTTLAAVIDHTQTHDGEDRMQTYQVTLYAHRNTDKKQSRLMKGDTLSALKQQQKQKKTGGGGGGIYIIYNNVLLDVFSEPAGYN